MAIRVDKLNELKPGDVLFYRKGTGRVEPLLLERVQRFAYWRGGGYVHVRTLSGKREQYSSESSRLIHSTNFFKPGKRPGTPSSS